ncbi:MAG TPA: twin-arginine translocase subunit TatC [Eubacteriaceae bacterium]|nr:twin-arginine translocase subunit TatC [Eubacteriaceae bacterium]
MMRKSRNRKMNKAQKEAMGIVDHLGEVRKRLFIAIGSFILLSLATFSYVDDVIQFLIQNSKDLGYQLVYLTPSELFTQYIKISLIAGIALASPIILYQIWAFIKPGLEKGEKRVVFLSLFFGMICFVMGVVFAYIVVVPTMFHFLMNVDQNNIVAPTISIQSYINFILSTLIMFGIVFELPVITVLLSELGLIRAEWMVKSRKIVIVFLFIVGALITPPDIISQVLVAIPILILFEFSIVLSRIIGARKKKRSGE